MPQPTQSQPASLAPPTQTPLSELVSIALPTVLQMASYTVMQFIDTYMLSFLGVDEPTAAGNSGIFAFSIIGFGVGVLFCVNALVSQNFGQKDYPACGRYLWQGVWFGLLFSVLMIPMTVFAPGLFRGIGHEVNLAEMEALFFRITVGATAIKLIGTALGQFTLAVNRPNIVLLAAVIGVTANACANWFLIFGKAGVPQLGVAGAAWGTNIGVTVEALVLAVFAFGPQVSRKFNTWDWRPRLREFKLLLSIGLPSGVQMVAEVLAWGLFSVFIIGQFGTQTMAANIFTFRFFAVSFMPAYGVSVAVTALVGRYIGAGRPDLAEQRAHLGFKVAATYMLACGAGYIGLRHQLMALFTVDPQVQQIGANLLIFAGIYQLFDAMNIIYSGALRGAGDTFVPAVATASFCWSITVGGGYLMARVFPQLGATGPWCAATTYGLLLGGYIFARFKRGKWKTLRLEGGADSKPSPQVDTVAVPV